MHNHNETPEIPIDEALELFVAVAYPQGIPEDVDKEELFRTLREKIAKDRPDWAEKSNDTTKNEAPPSPTGNYKEIKEAIISKSNESEVPEDPEERYLYERKQKVLKNMEAKKAEEEENANKEALRKKIIEKNKDEKVDEDFLNKTLRIKEELQKKLALLQSPVAFDPDKKEQNKPEFSETDIPLPDNSFSIDNKELPIAPQAEFSNGLPLEQELEPKANEVGFIKSIENLDRDERVKAMVEYNKTRRATMQTKESVLSSDQVADDRFSMGVDEKQEVKKINKSEEFLSYLIERRKRKPSDMENELKPEKAKEENMSISTTMDKKDEPYGFSNLVQKTNEESVIKKITDDMSMDGTKQRSGKLNVDYFNQSSELILE